MVFPFFLSLSRVLAPPCVFLSLFLSLFVPLLFLSLCRLLNDIYSPFSVFFVSPSSSPLIIPSLLFLLSQVGQIDTLVNNAGIVTGRKLLDCPDALIEKTFQVRYLQLTFLSHFNAFLGPIRCPFSLSRLALSWFLSL